MTTSNNSNAKGVFFAELDDDYQLLRGLTEDQLHERAVCYFLLAPGVIIHPAYIWQSEMTHKLISGPAGDLFTPPFTHLELGNYQNINDYMRRRIERLEPPAQPTRELRQYQAHRGDLFEEAQRLDSRFASAVSRPVSATARDNRFRDLLFRDLQATDLDRGSLAAQLGAFDINPYDADEGRKITENIQRFVRGPRLVSVDTVRARIRGTGFDELEASEDLRRRLLALYYETYADDRTLIPATSKLLFGQVVNHYDADVFWSVIYRLFGNECRVLSKPESREAVAALRQIRESNEWQTFTSMYFDTLQTVDDMLWAQPDNVIKRFDDKRPPHSTIFILKRLWGRRKIDLTAAAFGAAALAATSAPFGTGEAIGATSAGVVSLGFAGTGLIKNARRFMEEYRSRDMVKVKNAVKTEVNKVLAAIRANERGED
jgi:hypothetical protein